MNSETGNEPESPKKRGRIPQSAWPQILERYRAGATLSAIAREFSCTPSAISYIVRKAEAAGVDGGTEEAEPHETEAAVVTNSESAAAPEVQPAADVIVAPASTPEAQLEPKSEPKAVPVAVSAPAPVVDTVPATPKVAARPEPAPPVDEVEGRLRETARSCLVAYRGWRQTPGETTIQILADSVHELRKVLARIEIDISASRREEQALRPIPIPAHRAVRRPS